MRFLLILPILGCSLLPVDRTVAHCDIRLATEPRDYCQEWRGVMDTPGADASGIAVCDALGTEYAAEVCPDTESIVGGCFIGYLGDGSASYHWYYAPMTADQVRSACGSDTYVDWFAFDAASDDFGPPAR